MEAIQGDRREQAGLSGGRILTAPDGGAASLTAPDGGAARLAAGQSSGALIGDLQRDWARQETVPGLAEVQAQHGGGTGIAFARETQLLATPAPEQQPEPAGA